MDTTNWWGLNDDEASFDNMVWIATSDAGNDTQNVSLSNSAWFYPARNDTGGVTERALYNAYCEVSDTLNNSYAPGYPFLGTKAVRQ